MPVPAAISEQACLIGLQGKTITIDCDDYNEATELFNWLTRGCDEGLDEDE